MTIGSPAPQLDVAHWLGDPDPVPISRFEPGGVYIVEFWATWCGPCVAGFPHLAEIQSEYRSKGVTLIAVTSEELDAVESFLDRTLPSEPRQSDSAEAGQIRGAETGVGPTTYRDFTDILRLAADPDRSVFNDYMTAAHEPGIPTAFLVGKTGLIEWVGRPDGELDAALDQVLSDQWDREGFAESYRIKQQVESLWQRGCTALEQEDVDRVQQAVGELRAIGGEEADDHADHLEYKLEFLDVLRSIKTAPAVGEKRLEKLFTDMKDQPRRMFFATWNLLVMVKEGELKLDHDVLISLSHHCELVAESVNAGIDQGILLDVAGRAMSQAGEHDAAAALFRRAVAYAEDRSPMQLEGFQRDLQECLEKQQEAATLPPGEGAADG